ncbi:hypothetical protein ABER23_25395 [Paenibacillus lautus]|uniref:hypothetical protein n=1 Tax=Paenibacillus lautus TaxID=1401 RepID=UPI003D2AD5E5
MTNPVTPNIGLNKIDRTSPSTTYFDLEKYIDQNADAVDQFAGETSEAIGALEKRLDTEERREVVLQPGLQIVNAERSAPFKLSGIKGRTLVNLLGRDGDCEDTLKWTAQGGEIGYDISGRYVVGTKSIIVTNPTLNKPALMYKKIELDTSKHYYFAGYALSTLDVAFTAGSVVANETDGGGLIRFNPGSAYSFTRKGFKFKPTVKEFYITAYVYGDSRVATAAVFDALCLYEISAAEYNSLDGMSPEQIDFKYPYVDSVTPVRNPYVIRYGENLAPTLFEGTVERSTKVLAEYSALVKATGETVVEYRSNLIPAIPNTKYTLSAKITHNGIEKYNGVYVDVLGYDEAGLYVLDTPGTSASGTGTGTDTFATPANIKTMEVRIVAPQDAAVGDYVVEDITLNLGATVRTHKPREDCILALQTDLYSDPVTGVNADEVFEKDGQYAKLAKWEKVLLDGNLNWAMGPSRPPGGKQLKVANFPGNAVPGSGTVTRFDGKIIPQGSTLVSPDINSVSGDGNFYISVANSDSGWGDNYTPTADEIKAFFWGWKMYDASGSATTVYDGSGGKAWLNLTKFKKGDYSNWTTTLPTASAKEHTSYQLVYQLTSPRIEPIVSEGLLTFNTGSNQIEVGTGIVLRESVHPNGSGTTGDKKVINYKFHDIDTWLKSRLNQFLGIFKNNRRDSSWAIKPNSSIVANGDFFAQCESEDFDQTATYSVTYLMLDKSPIVPFTGSYAANEKAMLQELTDAVQQNATAVSVLMNKKADKDNSVVWVEPTLINGATEYTETNFRKPSYTKIGNWVKLSGLIKVTVSGTMFYLPPGYRPNKVLIFAGLSGGIASYTMMDLRVTPTGNVTVNTTSPLDWLSLDHIIFQAEQ